jgi:glycosyltransferase involved in cell wall biosynthesis
MPPVIPPAFALYPHRFLFTSPCSWEHPDLRALRDSAEGKIDVVFSAGGFDDLPPPSDRKDRHAPQFGYLGTLNFAKLHPDILDFLAAVRLPEFRLTLVGDPTCAAELSTQAVSRGLAGRLDFRGYRADVGAELADFDVLVYLLNPLHYGTTENALLEAMAMGVVPVVLDNPAERHLVAHGQTGLIVNDPPGFADAIEWLAHHPEERQRLAANAAKTVRKRFSTTLVADQLDRHYRAVLMEEKRSYDFRPIFGGEPADWFLACQGQEAWRFSDQELPPAPVGPHFLYEATKSSVFHYLNEFPDDKRLTKWAQQLQAPRA